MMLTDIQFHRAWALASAYGHEWASAVAEDSALRDPDDIRTATQDARSPYAAPGIDAPAMDGAGRVVHRTGRGRGRLSWQIAPDGTVTLFIHRPGWVIPADPDIVAPDDDLRVLRAQVDPEGHVEAVPYDAPWAPRHVRSLRYALRAIAGPEVVEAAIRRLPTPPEPEWFGRFVRWLLRVMVRRSQRTNVRFWHTYKEAAR